MSKKKSMWAKYLDRILQILESTQYNASPRAIARQINEEEELNLSPKKLDLLRTYVRREQQKQRVKSGLPKNKTPLESAKTENQALPTKTETVWDEKEDSAVYEYKGEKSIRTLEEALHFSEVDLSKWEVERHIFNSWDVSMKNADGTGAFKRTNYQVKVWFRRKQDLAIEKPQYRHITIEPKPKPQMWVIIGCVHRPFHDKQLWDSFLSFLEKNRNDITGIIINGDYLDLRSLSSHEEWIPDGVDLSMEYSDGLQGIEDIESRLKKNIRKIFIYGNHEDRFFRDKKSIRKYGSSLPSPHEALELDERGWEVITDWKNGYVTLGNNLDVFHGIKVGANAAKDQLNALPTRDQIFNHTHRFSTYSNNTNTAYNIGCMIDIDNDMFKYVDRGIRAAWALGFATAHIDEYGNNYVTPIKAREDKRFFFQGVVY
jgi:hypothetical protein